jgi:hypothetical protein
MSIFYHLRYFISIELSSMVKGFFLYQEKYIQDLLDRASLINLSHLRVTYVELLEDFTCYCHSVGSLVNLSHLS